MIGHPRFCAEELAQLLVGKVDEVMEDHNGNIICHKRGEGKKWMIRTAIGSSGLMVYHIDDKKRAYYNLLGDASFEEMSGAEVAFAQGGKKTVLAKESAAEKSLIDLYIPAEDGGFSIGDVASFLPVRKSVWTEQGFCGARDRLEACALAMLEFLSRCEDCSADLYFVFSAKAYDQFRGAMPAFVQIQPDAVLYVSEQPTTGNNEKLLLMCNSPMCVYNAKKLGEVEKIAERLNIAVEKCVREVKPNPTENDFDPSIQALSHGAQMYELALPVQHKGKEKTISALAVEQMAALLASVVCDA